MSPFRARPPAALLRQGVLVPADALWASAGRPLPTRRATQYMCPFRTGPHQQPSFGKESLCPQMPRVGCPARASAGQADTSAPRHAVHVPFSGGPGPRGPSARARRSRRCPWHPRAVIRRAASTALLWRVCCIQRSFQTTLCINCVAVACSLPPVPLKAETASACCIVKAVTAFDNSSDGPVITLQGFISFCFV